MFLGVLREAVGWGLIAAAVILGIGAIVSPAETAIFVVRGLRQLSVFAEYDASKGTLIIAGTGADGRIVELAIAAFVGVLGYFLRRGGHE